LEAGQAAQELVGHVLAQARLAKCRAGDDQRLRANDGRAVRLEPRTFEGGLRRVVNVLVDANETDMDFNDPPMNIAKIAEGFSLPSERVDTAEGLKGAGNGAGAAFAKIGKSSARVPA